MIPEISIIIPVKNGMKTLPDVLLQLRCQSIAGKMEVIAIDSGSSDGSVDFLRKNGVRLLEISPDKFGHGKTRNLGVQYAQGELCLLMTQDAIPGTPELLEKMCCHFEHPSVAAVTVREACPSLPGYNPLQWVRHKIEGEIKTIDCSPDEFGKMDGPEQRSCCFLSDVCTMYRTALLRQHPFDDVVFGEDLVWAKKALSGGWGHLISDGTVFVYHYHHESFDFTFQRTVISNYTIWKNFHYLPSNSFSAGRFIKVPAQALKYHFSPRWIFYNWRKMLAGTCGGWYLKKIIRKDAIKELERLFCANSPQAINIKADTQNV